MEQTLSICVCGFLVNVSVYIGLLGFEGFGLVGFAFGGRMKKTRGGGES